MCIEQRIIGDVVVLDLVGSLTLGQGDEEIKACLDHQILVGRRKFVLNLKGVPYVDSAGHGEITRSHTTVSRQGGTLVLAGPSERLEDIWHTIKLHSVFTIYRTVTDAVAALAVHQYELSCPSCRPVSWVSVSRTTTIHVCHRCGVTFAAAIPAQPDNMDTTMPAMSVPVDRLDWRPYEPCTGGYGADLVSLTLTRPPEITITGRLDLFVVETVLLAWETVPRPRRVIFNLRLVTRFSPVGLATLVDLCSSSPIDRGLLVADQSHHDLLAAIPADCQTFSADSVLASAHVDDSTEPVQIMIRTRA